MAALQQLAFLAGAEKQRGRLVRLSPWFGRLLTSGDSEACLSKRLGHSQRWLWVSAGLGCLSSQTAFLTFLVNVRYSV